MKMVVEQKPPSFLISVRFLIAIIAFLGYAVQYIQRINMSVAIVCMVNNTAIKLHNEALVLKNNKLTTDSRFQTELIWSNASLVEDTCYFKEKIGSSKMDGPFAWEKDTQGLVLSSYFYGYITMQIAGGALSYKYGAKIVLAIAILMGSILTIAAPFAARFSYIALIVVRFFTGVSHSSFWPSMSTLWSAWAPPTERSRLAGIANAGAQIGNVLALPLGGYLCQYGFDSGWPSIFYIFGLLGIIWFVLWMLLASATPKDHRFISSKERDYIIDQTSASTSEKEPILKVARLVFSSKSFYGVMIAHTTSNFGTYLFLTQLPTYMKEILKFDIKSNGTLSALPYIAFWLVTVVSSILGDTLIQSCKLSKTTVRKIFNTLGFIIPMGAVIGLAFVTCEMPYLGVGILVIGLSSTGFSYGCGFMVNYNDIAGSYAGLMFGIANTFGTCPGFIAPYLVGLLTKKQLQSEWQIVFFITAGVYLVGAIAFILLGSGETEEWAKKKATKNPDEENIPLK